MVIFDNAEYPNYEQVAEMGPSWWTEYREMDANYKFAGWTLDLAAYFLDMLINNEFPEHCDEETLAKFERILRIEYDTEMSMEERRRTVAAFWAGNGKLNKTAIEGIVNSYTGQPSDIRWEDETLVIDFSNMEQATVSISMMQNILRRRMPAHIDYQIRCVADAVIGVSPSKAQWPVSFDLTGTLPKLSYGLGLVYDSVEHEPSGQGWKVPFVVSSENEITGTIPKTSRGLGMENDTMGSEVTGQGWIVSHRMCGEDGLGT